MRSDLTAMSGFLTDAESNAIILDQSRSSSPLRTSTPLQQLGYQRQPLQSEDETGAAAAIAAGELQSDSGLGTTVTDDCTENSCSRSQRTQSLELLSDAETLAAAAPVPPLQLTRPPQKEGSSGSRCKSEEIVRNKNKARPPPPPPLASYGSRRPSSAASSNYRSYYSGCAIHSRPTSESSGFFSNETEGRSR